MTLGLLYAVISAHVRNHGCDGSIRSNSSCANNLPSWEKIRGGACSDREEASKTPSMLKPLSFTWLHPGQVPGLWENNRFFIYIFYPLVFWWPGSHWIDTEQMRNSCTLEYLSILISIWRLPFVYSHAFLFPSASNLNKKLYVGYYSPFLLNNLLVHQKMPLFILSWLLDRLSGVLCHRTCVLCCTGRTLYCWNTPLRLYKQSLGDQVSRTLQCPPCAKTCNRLLPCSPFL